MTILYRSDHVMATKLVVDLLYEVVGRLSGSRHHYDLEILSAL